MAILNERKYQELAACQRFQHCRDEYAALQQRLHTEPVENVESMNRVAMRREMIHPEDTLALERILGKTDLLSVNYLLAGQQAIRPVCRIHIRMDKGENGGYGTGFLISPTLLLTNYHVLESKAMARYSLAEFDYENDLNFVLKASKVFSLDPERFFYNNRELDFALVAVHPVSNSGVSLSEFGFFRLLEPSGKALVDEAVTIVQHPNGQDKQIALRNNRILGLIDSFIHYETDTLPGSSGSPVLNDQWQVVALHHAGVPKRDSTGRILAKDGQVWQNWMREDQIDWIANEGVRISAICNHLRMKNDWQPQELELVRDLLGAGQTNSTVAQDEQRNDLCMVTPKALPTRASTAPVITLDEFFAMVDCEGTTEAELAPYVRLDPQNSTAFAPVFRLNEALVVDTQGLESDRVLAWANDWARRRRQQEYRRKIAEGAPVIKIVSEGDSWFQFPFLLHDVIDYLMDREELAVFSLDAAGDQLQDMVAKAEYMDAIAQEQPDIFLISGGGNDLVSDGRLSSLLYPFEPGRAPKDYLNGAFSTFSDKVRADYRRLFKSITGRFPDIKIICHGYDYAIPQAGKWLGLPLAKNGIQAPELQRQIMRHAIDQMNDAIIQVAGEFSNVTYLNLRNMVSPDGWFDELHPLNDGFGDIANKFIEAIHAK